MINAGSLFSVVEMVPLGAVEGKRTDQCFVEDHYRSHGHEHDVLLPLNQPARGESMITILGAQKKRSFAQFASQLPGVRREASMQELASSIKTRGYTMTLPQVEQMVVDARRRSNALHDYDIRHFYFIDRRDGGIAVGCVRHEVEFRWGAYCCRFEYGGSWYVGSRLLVPNLDMSAV